MGGRRLVSRFGVESSVIGLQQGRITRPSHAGLWPWPTAQGATTAHRSLGAR